MSKNDLPVVGFEALRSDLLNGHTVPCDDGVPEESLFDGVESVALDPEPAVLTDQLPHPEETTSVELAVTPDEQGEQDDPAFVKDEELPDELGEKTTEEDKSTDPPEDSAAELEVAVGSDLSAIKQMLRDSKIAPLLRGAEVERQLAIRIEEGDSSAKEALFNANKRLVVSIAKRFQGRGVRFSDLIQEGYLGLLRAIDKFDYRKKIKFSTYATFWIEQKLGRSLADQSRTIRVPVYRHTDLNRLYRVRDFLATDLGQTPTVDQLAYYMDITEDEVRALIEEDKRVNAVAPLDAPIRSEDGRPTLVGDSVADPSADTFLEASPNLNAHLLSKLLLPLTDEERNLLHYKWGTDRGYERTWAEAAGYLGCTSKRTAQGTVEKILEKIRAHITVDQ